MHDQHLKELHTRLAHAIRLHVQVKQEQFGRAAGVLHAVSPLATLARGYAIVRKNEGRKRIVTEAGQVQTGETVAVTLHHGALVCRVEQASGSEGGIAERDAQSRTASNS